MTEALASLAGVLIAGGLITTRVSVVAGLLLAVSAVAYVGAAVLIGAMLPSAH
jgi:hypothetical protein